MSANPAVAVSSRPLVSQPVQAVALLFLGGLTLYFYADHLPPYFTFTEESYGAYYWQKRLALVFHLFGGSLALFTGVPQLWSGLSSRVMSLHRWIGRLYLLGVSIACVGLFIMTTTPIEGSNWGFQFALFGAGLAWVLTTGFAYLAIRRRNLVLHKQWMIRSYMVTFAFVTFRFLTDYVPWAAWGLDGNEFMTAMVWASWVPPLVAYDLMLQWRTL